MSTFNRTGFKARILPKQNVVTNKVFEQNKLKSSIEYCANTCLFFMYVSFIQAKQLNVVLYENTTIVQRRTDKRIATIVEYSGQCLSYLNSAYNDLLCYVENADELERIENIFKQSYSRVDKFLNEQQQNIFLNYKGKFFNDYENNFSLIASLITHVRRLLVATIKVMDDMVLKFDDGYPTLKEIVGFKNCAFAYKYIDDCYALALLGVNIDLTKDKKGLSIQRDLIHTLIDKEFYNKCCHAANVHL